MDKNRLENLAVLKKEIQLLEEELQRIPVVSDSVRGSMPEFPYVEVVVPISGIDDSDSASIRKKIEEKTRKLKRELLEVEDWLDTIPDSEARTILRAYYRQGMSQEQIAATLGYNRSSISKKIKNYLEKI